MTEVEWLACDDPEAMLELLAWNGGSNRRWRLLALACLEPLLPHLRDERLRLALPAIARDAERQGKPHELEQANAAAVATYDSIWEDPSEQRWFYVQTSAARAVSHATAPNSWEHVSDVLARCAHALRLATAVKPQVIACRHVALIHDIFGNPFRPIVLDHLWLTFDVQALARGIYDERAFERMPILADALQDAGCDTADVLTHCRDPKATHVRGCWVLDLLLGKG